MVLQSGAASLVCFDKTINASLLGIRDNVELARAPILY